MSTTIQSTAATNGESTMSDEQIDEALQTFADGFAQSYRAPVLHTPAEEGLELHPEPPAGHRRGTPQCEYQCCSIVGQENRAGSWEVWCRGSREPAGGPLTRGAAELQPWATR